ncbi:MAG: hypothetical protein ACFE0O_06175 [Opitutales bacterium]
MKDDEEELSPEELEKFLMITEVLNGVAPDWAVSVGQDLMAVYAPGITKLTAGKKPSLEQASASLTYLDESGLDNFLKEEIPEGAEVKEALEKAVTNVARIDETPTRTIGRGFEKGKRAAKKDGSLAIKDMEMDGQGAMLIALLLNWREIEEMHSLPGVYRLLAKQGSKPPMELKSFCKYMRGKGLRLKGPGRPAKKKIRTKPEA